MSGNEWEWCNDWYGGTFPSGTSDPTGPATGSARVIRGGYWSNYASFCTVAYRSYISNPYIRYYYVGFRVVLVP
jgi:formylglycine-generating enzyme required for sulfatase activity